MIGVLPIIDRDGEPAATLTWDGTMWRGSGKWTWFASEEVKTKIENAIKEHAELGQELFADMVRDADTVNGWQGFAGWFQSLGIALAAYGLDVDDDNIVWPFEAVGEPDQDSDPDNPPTSGESVS